VTEGSAELGTLVSFSSGQVSVLLLRSIAYTQRLLYACALNIAFQGWRGRGRNSQALSLHTMRLKDRLVGEILFAMRQYGRRRQV
jgi:hypothetical protein